MVGILRLKAKLQPDRILNDSDAEKRVGNGFADSLIVSIISYESKSEIDTR
jgi:hypothetical protein